MKKGFILAAWLFYLIHFTGCRPPNSLGPLKVCEENPRYFANPAGEAVYLTGTHTWNNLVEMVSTTSQTPFNYAGYLDTLVSHHHNFFRLWAWDLLNWNTIGNRETYSRTHAVYPQPWLRTAPGLALDGKPRFDLTVYNPEYFHRLRKRVSMAADRGLYVSVMLFEGWGTQFSPGAYRQHPFHPANNAQNLPLDPEDSLGLPIYTLAYEEITGLQEAYVRKVIETINEFDNVLYEISNENHPGSTEWQYHMIRFIKQTESEMSKTHPVGMTFQYRGGSNQTLFDSPADWISPNPEGGYAEDPPASTGAKVIITDTDHLWGIGGSRQWVWKSFFRGLNPILMDPYDGKVLDKGPGSEWAGGMRRTLGYTYQLAGRIDLLHCVPAGHLSSSSYCLAHQGKEYLVYLPDDQPVTLDLSQAAGIFHASWFSSLDGTEEPGIDIEGGGMVSLSSPFGKEGAILHICR